MMIPMGELLAKAKKEGYGVAAPNVFNRETIEACFLAAKKLRAPIILDVAAVHGSTCAYEKNVEEVKEIVKIAHAVGTSVEAELGHVGQGAEYEETRDAGLTKLEEALKYVEETGVDCLAVAVGTSHGVYKGEPHLEFELLDHLSKEVPVPLVLHGGSGTGDENLAKAVRTGIQKVNLNTDVSEAGKQALREALASTEVHGSGKDEFTPKKMNLQQTIAAGVAGFQAELEHYMKLFGSENRW